jgi:hypothetical protein
LSSGIGVVSIGQFTVHASGLNTLDRSTKVAAQEVQEGLTTQLYNEVIFALATLYLIALNALVKIIQGHQSTHVESKTVPPILPMELFRVSQCDMIALVRNHKKKLVNHFQEKAKNVIKSICDQCDTRC